MDDQLAERAHGKSIEHLETWRDQLTALDGVVAIDDLREAIHARRTMRCELAQMRALYDSGDLDAMAKVLIVPRIAPALVYARNEHWLPELEAMPFVDQLPDPKAMVESSFGFVEELLGTQKDFALKVVDAMTPAKKPA